MTLPQAKLKLEQAQADFDSANARMKEAFQLYTKLQDVQDKAWQKLLDASDDYCKTFNKQK